VEIGARLALSPPALLTTEHDVSQFDCGKPALNRWLQRYAHSNQRHGFTRVLVVCAESRVVGYYGLAPTAVDPIAFPRRIRTGQPPAQIPAILIGQLAVDVNLKGHGIGSAMLRHALERAVQGIGLLGGRAVLVEAIDEEAEAYWISNGFEPIVGHKSTLFRSAADIENWLASA
jgi:GNAT superfamily N-acetyltransferase